MSPIRRALPGLALALMGAAGCASASGPPQPETKLVVGIQSEGLANAIGTFHVVATLDGVRTLDRTLAGSSLPQELPLLPPAGNAAAAVAVRVEGYVQPGWVASSGGSPALVRTAEAHFEAGRTMLLRVMLDGTCLLALPGGPPGGPVCAAPETCIAGVCQSDAESVEPYASDWPATAPDVCKPANAGPGIVQVGTGQTDYLPLANGQAVAMEQGPQGGHHIWIAIRQENLSQNGATTTITSAQPGGLMGPKTSYVFPFDPDQGGFCKLAGLRYQLDADGADYHSFLGMPLTVSVTVADPSGKTATGVAHITIDSQLLCPMGLSGCP
ncbi:MAG: hypothetical protein ACREJ3_16115 [Polyangiaceae bacterium]